MIERTTHIILDAGAIYTGYGTANEKCLGATSGDSQFIVETEFRDIPVNGLKGPTKGLTRIVGVRCRLITNLFESTAENLKLALAGSSISTDSEGTIITRETDIADSDYIDNISIVADMKGKEKGVILTIFNALSRGNFEVTFRDKEESSVRVEFEGHFNVADNTEPWEIKIID